MNKPHLPTAGQASPYTATSSRDLCRFSFFALALFFLHMIQPKPCKNDKNEQFPKHQAEANTEHNDGCGTHASENISLFTGCLAGKL